MKTYYILRVGSNETPLKTFGVYTSQEKVNECIEAFGFWYYTIIPIVVKNKI